MAMPMERERPMGCSAMWSPQSKCHRGNGPKGVTGLRLSEWGGCWWQKRTNTIVPGKGTGQWVSGKWGGPGWMPQGKWAKRDHWLEDEPIRRPVVADRDQ